MEQKEYDKKLLELIPIKNIQISGLGCYIVVFKTTTQQTINLLKSKGFIDNKKGIYHYLNNNEITILISNRKNTFFSQHISKDLLQELNLLDKYLMTKENQKIEYEKEIEKIKQNIKNIKK